MIVMFRERGSDEIADNLEAAAEKQAEAHLKTQQLMMNKHKPPQIQTPANESPAHKQTKSRTPSLPLSGSEILSSKRSIHRTSVRNSQCSLPSQYSMATTSESELESEGEVEDGEDHERSRSRKPSGILSKKQSTRICFNTLLMILHIYSKVRATFTILLNRSFTKIVISNVTNTRYALMPAAPDT